MAWREGGRISETARSKYVESARRLATGGSRSPLVRHQAPVLVHLARVESVDVGAMGRVRRIVFRRAVRVASHRVANGSGPTVPPFAVLRSASLIHPSL